MTDITSSMDPHKKNFKNVDGKWFIYDFEDAKKPDDESAYEEDDDEDERKAADLVKQKSFFENPFDFFKN